MPKYRQLHTKIIDSFDFNEMPDDFTRVVWMLLTLILDSEGRGIDNMAWVKSKMFPLRDDVTSEQLCAVFEWLENRAMIQRYEVKERRYFVIPTFQQYQSGTQKEAASLLPCPPISLQSNSGATQEKVSVAASASESVFESESALNCLNTSEDEKFDVMRGMIQHMTGYPALPRDIPVIIEFVQRGVIDVDIREALTFLASVNKIARGAADLKGSVFTALGKRTQGNHKNGKASLSDIHFDNEWQDEKTN
jgi:hypothetical protein